MQLSFELPHVAIRKLDFGDGQLTLLTGFSGKEAMIGIPEATRESFTVRHVKSTGFKRSFRQDLESSSFLFDTSKPELIYPNGRRVAEFVTPSVVALLNSVEGRSSANRTFANLALNIDFLPRLVDK